MRRAADRLLRTAKRTSVGRLCTSRCFDVNLSRTHRYTGLRSVSSFGGNHGPLQTFQSAMYLRQFSVAAIASIVASGLWYYRGEPDQKGELTDSPTTTRGLLSNPSVFPRQHCGHAEP